MPASEKIVERPAFVRGRGAVSNPKGRFERLELAPDAEAPAPLRHRTQLFRDTSKKIVTFNDSPDHGMHCTLNPYRGCEHGCIYCFARPTHEYLGLSAGLDFETKVFVKIDAPELLRKTLSSPKWIPQTIGMSGVTDPYQPIERRLKITRGCLEVLAEFRNPVGIITKNALVTRDIDLLARLADFNAVKVNLSITSLDRELARVLEPRTAQPKLRLQAVRELTAAGIPVNVMIAPIIPGLTDEEIPSLLQAVAEAGAESAAYTMLRLPFGVKDLFEEWLEAHFPLRKQKVLNRIRDVRGGKLNDANFGSRMEGAGRFAENIDQLFTLHVRKFGLDKKRSRVTAEHFKKPSPAQMEMF